MRRLHKLSEVEAYDFIASVESGATVVSLPDPVPRVVAHDPDDDMVVATAVVGKADVLCTRNQHLFHESVVAYCREHAIEVMDDLALLARLRESEKGPKAT